MGEQQSSNRWGGKAPKPGATLEVGALKTKQLTLEQEAAANTITIQGVLDGNECCKVIEAAEHAGLELQTSRGPKFGEAERHHQRVSFDDPAFADALWAAGLSAALTNIRVGRRRPLGLNPNIRIYQYVPGDLFGQHVDGSNEVATGRTEYTLLIYLTGAAEGLVGGETAFYSDGGRELVRIMPVAGSALLHRHGPACLLHEALPVLAGTKYVLRSDVVFPDA
eukprot:gnl/MRDRNA2_/MRDRNA2_151749_c0_seq1.p1 gnl/MRDRNA2_/MRDRNA2_151749_c0~~gnl/MRDRNA2_/MRDRNA2_151749_c0_seq1.p1  ORF type:complete len:223 (-),score=44.20 gnl/MRDRNA2_/MRDRNA2_151749_c0_seq1:256-924(-)